MYIKLKIRAPRIFTTLLFILLNQLVALAQGEVVWKFETGGRIYSSPIIDGDIVFVGSGDKSFYAINKNTGKSIWKFKTEGAVHSSPAIVDNIVFFGSADGNLYALNKKTGNLIWKFESNGEKMYGPWDYYLSSPKEDSGVIYWGSGDGNIYAINGLDGELIWKFQTGDVIHASPVIDETKVYIGGFDGYFYCINKKNGELVWKFKTIGATYFPKGEIQKAALLDDGVLYFGSRDYNIYALDANTGRGRWNMKQPRGWIIATPMEYKGNIYFGTSDAHIFFCINKEKGITIWTVPLNMRVYGTATAYKDIVYFGTFDGKLIGVDYLTGEKRWEFRTEKSKLNYSTVYSKEGKFNEDFKDYLDFEAKIQALGSILSSPVIDGEFIYFGSSDGFLYALGLK